MFIFIIPLSFFHRYFPVAHLGPFQSLSLYKFVFLQLTHCELRGLGGLSTEDDYIKKRIMRTKMSNSTLSSVYVITESHEKRMRVAGQCALRFAGKIHVVSYFCFKILGNLKHRRFISTFYTWKGR